MSIPLSDTARKFLVDLGYNVTRSFSYSIAPLQILDKSSQANVFEVIGKASEMFYHPEKNPEIRKVLTADIFGKSTRNLSISLTVSFLDDFLKNSIFGEASLKAVFTNVRTFTTKFSNCSSDVVFALEASSFLINSSQGGINEGKFVTSRILDNTSPSNPAYIITETLKAQEITMSGKDEKGLTITPNIEILKTLKLGGDIQYTVTDEGEVKLTHIIPPVFAFKACPLWIINQVLHLAPLTSIPGSSDVAVSDIPLNFAIPSSLHNPEILTPVLLSRSGMPVRIDSSKSSK